MVFFNYLGGVFDIMSVSTKNVYDRLQEDDISLMECMQGNVETHKHNFLELVYIVSGKGLHTLNDKQYVVSEGNYFIIDFEAAHKYELIDNKKFELINLLFLPKFIDKTLGGCKSFRDLIHSYQIRLNYDALSEIPTNIIFTDEDKSILNLFEKIRAELSENHPGSRELVRCYLLEIIIKSMRRIVLNTAKTKYTKEIKYMINYVEENYTNEVSLTKISETLNFAASHLSRAFKNAVGISFCNYLQRKRMEQACHLLATTTFKISDVAEQVGYADVKFFNQVFKKHIQVSPLKFRKLH